MIRSLPVQMYPTTGISMGHECSALLVLRHTSGKAKPVKVQNTLTDDLYLREPVSVVGLRNHALAVWCRYQLTSDSNQPHSMFDIGAVHPMGQIRIVKYEYFGNEDLRFQMTFISSDSVSNTSYMTITTTENHQPLGTKIQVSH